MPVSHLKLPPLSKQDATRFWAKVVIKNPDECWPWIAGNNRGYGAFRVVRPVRRQLRAHRVAYFLTHGDDPVGYLVRHTCDNPPCCNGSHLLKGNDQDNMRDASERGRMKVPHDKTNLRRGDNHWTRTKEGRKRAALHLLSVPRVRGEQQHSAKMSTPQVRHARESHAKGVTVYQLARKYKISWTSMNRIIKHVTWKHA